METIPNNFERELSPEEYTSCIVLYFMRHGDRERRQEGLMDCDVELTPEGRKQAQGQSQKTNLKQAVAFGSSRDRTQQTAGFVMAGKESEITGEESLKELKNKLDKDLKLGSKIGSDERLDHFEKPGSKYTEELLRRIVDGEPPLKLIVEESDEMAKEFGDMESLTYSKAASNVASIIGKYLKVSETWDRLVQNSENQYDETLERFLGSHQTISESFLSKVIDKTRGREERDEFIDTLGDGEGFGFVEGFKVEILRNDLEEPEIKIKFEKEKDGEIIFEFDEVVDREIIDEIISEGKDENV